ncbi:TrbC/VirB2 family protein [Candidatus Saccharibacteria bacterium]|nr:TrbC/VirB2 family protein [Candidatus Saccharibacteria bacterium]
MKITKTLRVVAFLLVLGLPFLVTPHAYAQATGGNISNVENFIRNVIQIIAGLAGLIATGFFVAGGFGYITSSGNPENLEKSKRTLIYAAVGLAITIGAFVLSNIISDVAAKAFGG